MSARSDELLRMFKNAAERESLHHGFILTGAETIGKNSFLQDFMLFFLREKSDLIGDRIKRGVYPDFFVLESSEGIVSVESIRLLPKECAYPPLESKKRFVIIKDAALMNRQASNALLKILEEPPAHTIFFLLCNSSHELLPTIRSRCMEFSFAPLSPEEVRSRLGTLVNGEELNELVDWCEGSTVRLDRLLQQSDLIALWRKSKLILNLLWKSSPRIPLEGVTWLEQVEGDDVVSFIVDSWLREKIKMEVKLASLDSALFLSSPIFQKDHDPFSRFRMHSDRNGNSKLNLLNLYASLQISPQAKNLI